MRELNYQVTDLIQHATGRITYGVPVDGDTIIVNGNTLTKVAATPGAGEFSSDVELEALIEAIAGINSSLADGIITVEAAAPGTAGNAITLELGGSNTGTMEISGPTLTGGVAATYTDWIEFDGDLNPAEFDGVIDIDALSGGSPTVTITPQVSQDKENAIDRTATSALNATGVTELHTTQLLSFFRYKIVLGGTTPKTSLKINGKASA